MSEQIGRPLSEDELVHHRNEVKTDNRAENLEIKSRPAHAALHHSGENNVNWKGGKKPVECRNCGKPFVLAWGNHYRASTQFCSTDCRDAHQHGENAPNVKLSDAQVAEIRSLKGTMGQREIARRFDIGKTQVARIHRGESR